MLKKYPLNFFVVLIWLISILLYFDIYKVIDNYMISLTMLGGSIIAGLTAMGGGAIAFPVLTKILEVSPNDAKTFSLMIQAVGMSAAAIYILKAKIIEINNFFVWILASSMIGQVIGLYLPQYPPVYNRVLFTVLVSLFIVISKMSTIYKIKEDSERSMLLIIILGFLGGMLASKLGSGLDMLVFIGLTFHYGYTIKKGTAMSVCLMAAHSVFSIPLIHFIDSAISEKIIYMWLAAVPIVVVGAPFGAYLCNKLSESKVRIILQTLVCIEVLSTVLIIPFSYKLALFSFIILSVSIFLARYLLFERTDPLKG